MLPLRPLQLLANPMRPTLLLAGLLPLLPAAALAQAARIDEVLVYPGGAQVTRLASAPRECGCTSVSGRVMSTSS